MCDNTVRARKRTAGRLRRGAAGPDGPSWPHQGLGTCRLLLTIAVAHLRGSAPIISWSNAPAEDERDPVHVEARLAERRDQATGQTMRAERTARPVEVLGVHAERHQADEDQAGRNRQALRSVSAIPTLC